MNLTLPLRKLKNHPVFEDSSCFRARQRVIVDYLSESKNFSNPLLWGKSGYKQETTGKFIPHLGENSVSEVLYDGFGAGTDMQFIVDIFEM